MKKQTAKRALFMSAMSLLLCVSMLVGTTFAWFTDSVTSANNIIKSGNLDVEMYWAKGDEEPANADWKDASQGAIFNYNLWEPGYTEVRHIKIENKGSLALRYHVSIAANGEVSNLADVIDVYYVDPAVQVANRAALTDDYKLGTLAEVLTGLSETANGSLVAGAADTITIALKMQESAGNQYMNKAIGTNFSVKLLATQYTYEDDSFDDQYDKNAMLVTSAAEAQAALDNAVSGTAIRLAPGVNYGTLYFRAIPGETPNTEYFGNAGNGNRDGYRRTLENISIIGADGATVDAILFEDSAVSGNRSSSFTVKNLLIKGVTFTAEGGADYNYSQEGQQYFDDGDRPAILLRLNTISFDGITIENCTRVGECNYNFVRTYGHSADATDNSMAKNLTITGCKIDGGKRLCSLYPCENVTITNNTIKNTAQHGIHLSGYSTYTYSGNVTITGNTADSINDRFVRMSGGENATIVIKGNITSNYLSGDPDHIKVTNSANVSIADEPNVTIENNPMTRKYVISTADRGAIMTFLQTGVEDGATVYFEAEEYGKISLGGGHFNATLPKNITIECAPGAKLSLAVDKTPNASVPFDGVMDGWTFKNVNFVDDGFRLQNGAQAKNITFEGCTFSGGATFYSLAASGGCVDGAVFNKCYFNDTVLSNVNKNAISIQAAKNITVTNCVFENVRNAVNLGATAEGEIVIDSNEIKSGTDRIFRITDAGAVYTITNNVIGYNGDASGELIKVTNAANATLNFSGNNWNGKTDSEVTAGMVGSDYIVKKG